ncbi:MAG: hypothetical protein HYZ72_07190 [Deltaproteobacteria bacterium]|nr:hypothetical protein [Deltaproteobacteria bacterium]
MTTREFFTFQTAASPVAWLNSTAGFGAGQGNLTTREFRLEVYPLET